MADWVEVFAPVVYEPHRPSAWPAGSVVLDHIPFRVRTVDEYGFPIRAGDVAFVILVALGYDQGRPKLWRLRSSVQARPDDWEEFLRGLDGAPTRVVCDAHSGIAPQ